MSGTKNTIRALAWVAVLCFLLPAAGYPESRRVEGVVGRGEAMVVGITAEQGQLLAIQRARADAIERAAGISVLGSTLIRDGFMVGEFLKTFSTGLIVEESVRPGGRMVAQPGGFPIANFTADIVATVVVPKRDSASIILLESNLDRPSYVAGDYATLTSKATRRACIGIFNIRADDRIAMIFPHRDARQQGVIEAGHPFRFPSSPGVYLEMNTLPDHEMDTEAFMVVAVPEGDGQSFRFEDFFEADKLYSIPEFFGIYSLFADKVVEKILPYEVRRKPGK